MSTRGIVYVAVGEGHLAEAKGSAARARECMPELPRTLFTDRPPDGGPFEEVVAIDGHGGFGDKIECLRRSPYDETLFLDADTWMARPVPELFALLQRFDLAAALAPWRVTYTVDAVPGAFPELNTGVIAFRRSAALEAAFARWSELYRRDRHRDVDWKFPAGARWFAAALTDQPSFRQAVFESDLRVATLPSEYNCRLTFPGSLHGPVKILHGRVADFAATAAELDRTLLPRAHRMRWGRVRSSDGAFPPGKARVSQLRWSIHHRGLVGTVRQIVALVRGGSS